MSEQPTALRLADELQWVKHTADWHVCDMAADELRRLSAWNARLTVLAKQRDELLEALKLIEHATAPTHNDGAYHETAYEIARAAIATA